MEVLFNLYRQEKPSRTEININNTPYFYDNRVGIVGLHRHITNNNLWLATAPDYIDTGEVDNISKAFENVNLPMNKEIYIQVKGLENVLKTILRMHSLSPFSNLHILAIGPKQVINIYNHTGAKKVDENKDEYEFLSPIQNETVYLHHLAADISEDTIQLNSGTLETLYSVYKQTVAAGQPLLIHCQTGLDFTPIFAFAFELLRKWDIFFSSKNIPANGDQAELFLNALRASLSPEALSRPLDIRRAFDIAFALKSIDLEKQIQSDLYAFISTRENDAKFTSRKDLISEILKTYPIQPSLRRGHYLKTMLENHKELRTHHWIEADGLEFLRSDPGHYALLKCLKDIAQFRADVEIELCILCNSYELFCQEQLSQHENVKAPLNYKDSQSEEAAPLEVDKLQPSV